VPYTVVVMLLPLKQGLKPTGSTGMSNVLPGCYATSIKTRIETCGIEYGRRFQKGCYATSIKTRIETFCFPLDIPLHQHVVMLLPLKQGLKPFSLLTSLRSTRVVMLLPLKQGLKPIVEEH